MNPLRQPTIRELRDRLDASVEAARAVEALKVAVDALNEIARETARTADEHCHCHLESGPCSVCRARAELLVNPGEGAALKSIGGILDEGYVPEALRDE